MKIAYITMQFPVPSETFASLDVKALEELGDNVEIYSMRPRHKEFDKLVKQRGHDKDKIHHLSIKNFFAGIRMMVLYPVGMLLVISKILQHCSNSPKHVVKSLVLLPSTFYIFGEILKNQPDIVHLFWGHYPSLCLILIKKYKKGLPITIFLGAQDLEEKYALSSLGLRESDLIFTHSKSNIGKIQLLGGEGDKINVVYRGTVVPNAQVSKNTARHRTSNESGVLHILTAARLIEEKGIDDVLRLAGKLRQEGIRFKVTVAGAGPDRNRLIAICQAQGIFDQVNFIGHTSQKELFGYMESADFFILLSRYYGERLPNVVKEAMVHSVIPITTPTQGIDELIDSGVDGWVVKDVDDALKKLKYTIGTPSVYQEMSRKGKIKIMERFDVKQNMFKYRQGWEHAIRSQ